MDDHRYPHSVPAVSTVSGRAIKPAAVDVFVEHHHDRRTLAEVAGVVETAFGGFVPSDE